MYENAQKHRMVLDSFLSGMGTNVEQYANHSQFLTFPQLNNEQLFEICSEVEALFSAEPSLLSVSSQCIIVGDLHGHVLDLLRILNHYGLPVSQKYLFVGDLVDRGEFSLEVVVIVFLMKIIWPKNVLLIRGNHEFSFMCNRCGFALEISNLYNDVAVFDAFCKAFSVVPLGAIVDRKILCIHGGIGPSIYSLQQILELSRPIHDFGNEFIDSLLWSDPSDAIDTFNPSFRGMGYTFGKGAAKQFMESNGIDLIIRGHECVKNGCTYSLDDKVLTVFSASNYCGLVGNESGIVIIKRTGELEMKRFPSLEYLKRADVFFQFNKGICKIKPVIKRINCSESTSLIPKVRISEPIRSLNHLQKSNVDIPKKVIPPSGEKPAKKRRNATLG